MFAVIDVLLSHDSSFPVSRDQDTPDQAARLQGGWDGTDERSIPRTGACTRGRTAIDPPVVLRAAELNDVKDGKAEQKAEVTAFPPSTSRSCKPVCVATNSV